MKCGTVLRRGQGHDPTEAKLLFGFREQPAHFHLRLVRQLQDFGAAAITEQQQLLVILPTPENEGPDPGSSVISNAGKLQPTRRRERPSRC